MLIACLRSGVTKNFVSCGAQAARQQRIRFVDCAGRPLLEKFRKEAGLNINHVPYQGGAEPATTDVLAGHVELFQLTATPAMSFIKSGRIKALVISTKERLSDPKVKARFAEAGVIARPSESPAEFKAYVARETLRWSSLVKEIGAVPE